MDDLRRDKELSIATRMVGLEIFSCTNRRSGYAFPSEVTIAHRLGITDRWVRTAVKQLAAAGYIKLTRRCGRSNVYSPAFIERNQKPTGKTPELSSGVTQEDTSGVGTSSDNPGTTIPQTPELSSGDPGTAVPPNSVLNPIINSWGSLATAPPKGALRSPQARKQQETENEIANALGWLTFTAMPPDEAEDLRKRWPNVGETERLELKRKYAPTASGLEVGCGPRPQGER